MSAADDLRPLLFGDAPIEAWGTADAAAAGEPWSSFALARDLVAAGRTPEAVEVWRSIAATDGLESRQALQAWTFLRGAGEAAPADVAKLVLGVVAEVPIDDGHDLLAAYADGSARYLNHAGGATIVEAGARPDVQAAVDAWLAEGRVIVPNIGPWTEPALPPLPTGHLRVTMLTPSGPHFGQGPEADLGADPMVGAYLGAATTLLQLIV